MNLLGRTALAVTSLMHGVTTAAPEESLPPLKDGRAPQDFEALWAGYDPRREPLDVEVLKEWEDDGIVLKVLRYRIGIFKGQRAMMAAVYGYPKGSGKLPGLVQIHGGGQYADSNAVFTNAKRGYATLSIAWAGRINAPGYQVDPAGVQLFWDGATANPAYKPTTDWGALDGYHAPCRNLQNAFANVSAAAWTLDAVASPRNNPWFLCTLGARRALTFLEQQPQVDAGKLGVYGHSMGGKLTVLTAAADPRVRAAAPSCGGLSDRPTDNALYAAAIADAVNLRHLACPIIFLSPANDFHGRIDDLQRALDRSQRVRSIELQPIRHPPAIQPEVTMKTTRRQFLQRLAPIAGVLAAPNILRAANLNGRVHHACIGVGGMGYNDFQNFKQHVRTDIVAICDVDAGNLARALQEVPAARPYQDWRDMLAKEGAAIDSVNASVPDHMHAAICFTAMQAGKHVYCQKPMCHDVADVRALTRLAAEKHLKTQLGNQHASGIGDRMAVEYLKAGVIGKIKHVYLCSNRVSGMPYRLTQPQPPQAAVPAGLAWDLWLGTAPARPFAAEVYHPAKWRSWLDFGTGWSGDIGCHIFSAPWKALGLKAPISIEARVNKGWLDSPALRAQLWPQANHLTWVFPGNGLTEDGKPLTVEWFDGVERIFISRRNIANSIRARTFRKRRHFSLGKPARYCCHTPVARNFFPGRNSPRWRILRSRATTTTTVFSTASSTTRRASPRLTFPAPCPRR